MTDKQWMASVRRITNPVKMLRTIVESERFLGYDPYYADLRKTMIEQAEKVVELSRARRTALPSKAT